MTFLRRKALPLTDNSSIKNDTDNNDWLYENSDTEDDGIVETAGDQKNNSSEDESNIPLSIRLEKFMNDFKWTDDGLFSPTVHSFVDQTAGVQPPANVDADNIALKVFKEFFTQDMIDSICVETDLYYEKKLKIFREAGKLKPQYRILKWKSLTPDELYTFIALIILVGIVKKPSYVMYWSTDPMMETPFFAKCIHLRRFQSILQFSHLVDDDEESSDKIRKIRTVIEFLIQVDRFQAVCRPDGIFPLTERF